MSTNNKKIKVGIIGSGFGEKVHLPAFKLSERCEVQGITSGDPEKSKLMAEKHLLGKSYHSWRDMLEDDEIDAVSIATPPCVQPEIAIKALSESKSVFCEKPLSVDLDDAIKMSEAAKKSGTANMVDFEFIELDEWKKTREIINSGTIGALRHISVNWSVETYANKMKLDTWKNDFEKGGGTLHTFASHVFFYLEWLAGPIKELSFKMWKMPGDTRSADTLNVFSMELESGVPSSVVISSQSFKGNGHKIVFYGESGTLILENNTSDYITGFRLMLATRDSEKFDLISSNEDWTERFGDGRVAAVSRIISRFVEWIDTSTPTKPDINDGLRVQRLIAASKRSASNGTSIKDLTDL